MYYINNDIDNDKMNLNNRMIKITVDDCLIKG